MKTLIVPCGGKSSRFANMRPKYLLTHPSGEIMVKKAISGINLDSFDRIVITIVRPHCEQYEADVILRQAFGIDSGSKIELCILPDFTRSQSETVYRTIIEMKISGEIAIKDSDNCIEVPDVPIGNYIIGLDINTFEKEINRIGSKSFVVVNEQNNVVDIIEKRIVSEHICLGMYGFESADKFCSTFETLNNSNNKMELYISHIISYMIGMNSAVFKYIKTDKFDDWGTLRDWQIVQSQMKTYFVDFDGVIVKNIGKYGVKNWSNCNEIISENLEALHKLYVEGAQIVVTTSRSKEYEGVIKKIFSDAGIELHAIVFSCNHSGRVLINDFAPTNAYPTCSAISVPRNTSIKDYLHL